MQAVAGTLVGWLGSHIFAFILIPWAVLSLRLWLMKKREGALSSCSPVQNAIEAGLPVLTIALSAVSLFLRSDLSALSLQVAGALALAMNERLARQWQ